MFRLLIGLFISISVGRWIYSEIELVAPRALPLVDFVLEKTSIPTHDQWSKDSFDQLLRGVDKVVQHSQTIWNAEMKNEGKQPVKKYGPNSVPT